MSDRAIRYGMILLDGDPSILCVRGTPVIFRSMDETVEYARMHDVQRWMVFGDPEGWWPLYTQDGPVNPPPPPKERIDISLARDRKPGLAESDGSEASAGASPKFVGKKVKRQARVTVR